MNKTCQKAKKHIVASLHNLPAELQEAVKAQYPYGFTDAMMRVDKPNGDFFYAVPFDTEEVAYLVKVDVKIDDQASADEEDKGYYGGEDGEELNGADEFQGDSTMSTDELAENDDVDY